MSPDLPAPSPMLCGFAASFFCDASEEGLCGSLQTEGLCSVPSLEQEPIDANYTLHNISEHVFGRMKLHGEQFSFISFPRGERLTGLLFHAQAVRERFLVPA